MIADETFGAWHDATPTQRNYDKAKKFDIGIIVQWHTIHTRMRVNILLNGTTLANMRNVGFTDYDILHWLKSMPNCKFSRIDIAVTSEKTDGSTHGFLPSKIHYLALNGLLKSKLKLDKPVTNKELEVETCYIGSRKARNRLFRAYDKGLERGMTPNYVVRYELETRKNANHVVNELYEQRSDIGAIIRRYVDFPEVEDWIQIMGTDTAENYRIDDDRPQHVIDLEAHNSRLAWLFNSVAPAIAKVEKHIETHEGQAGIDELWYRLQLISEYFRNRL